MRGDVAPGGGTGRTGFQGTSRFEIVRQIGTGGMGVVYEALDRQRKTRVALKTLRRLDPADLYRLKSEFRSLADLQHPNLVRLDELCCDEDEWFFTMELVEGSPFLAYVRGNAPFDQGHDLTIADTVSGEAAVLPPGAVPPGHVPRDPARDTIQGPAAPAYIEERVREGMRQLAVAVATIHDAGKLHRDIKPSNVLVTPEGRVVLLDFGLVTETATLDQAEEIGLVGTAGYMAPEQAASRNVGPAADWYSMGVVLYEALTGRLPHQGTFLEILMSKQKYEPPPPRQLVPRVPRDLDQLCSDLLRKDPAARPRGQEILSRLGASTPSVVALRPMAASLSHPLPFVGRAGELVALERSFDDMMTGRSTTVLVQGESGVGKSALVRHFCDRVRAEHPEVLVLRGRCYEKESVPYKAFDDIVDGLTRQILRLHPREVATLLPEDAGHLGRLFPVLRRIPAVERLPDRQLADPQQIRNRALAAFRTLLSRLRRRQPVVMVIDDFQWADADSLVLLRELLHAPAPPLLLVLTARTAREGSLEHRAAFAAALGALPLETRRIELRALGLDEAADLARRHLARSEGLESVDAAELAREAGGHPLFLLEMIRHLEVTGGTRTENLRLDDALLARIERLPPPARRLLEAVAVAGEPMRQSMAGQAAHLEPAEAHEQVALLRSAFLVRTTGSQDTDLIEPYHDRVRESLLTTLDAEVRRGHHAAWARVLEIAGEAPETLVRHLQAIGDGEAAAVQAEAAAYRAVEALAFDQAVRLFRLALEHGQQDPAHRQRLHMRLGEALENSGRGREAAQAYLHAMEGAGAATRNECQRRAAEQLLICGHIEDGLKVLEDLLATVGERLPRTMAGALGSLLWERIRLRARGFRWRERDESEIAQTRLLRADIYRTVSVGLALVDPIRGAAFQTRASRTTMKLGEKKRICLALATEAPFVAMGGDAAGGQRLIEAAEGIARRTSDPVLSAYMHAARCVTAYVAGRFRTAHEESVRALDILTQQTVGTTFERNAVRYFGLAALMQMGRLGEIRVLLEEYVRDAERRGDRYARTSLTTVVAHAWLTDDDVPAARARLADTDWAPLRGAYHLQHFYAYRAGVELALYEKAVAPGDDSWREMLANLRRALLLRIKIQRAETYWLVGRILVAKAEAGGGAADLAEADRFVRRLVKEKVPYALTWAHLVEGALHHQRGEADATAAALRAAVTTAESAEQNLAAACARRRLGLLLGGDEGAALLRDANAWFVAQGIHNPGAMTRVIAPGYD